MTKKEYLLIQLISECAEVQHIATKCLQFGMNNHHPDTKEENQACLEVEIMHIISTVSCLEAEQFINDLSWRDHGIHIKTKKIEKMMKVSQDEGILEK